MALDPSIFALFKPRSVADYQRDQIDLASAQQGQQLNALQLLSGRRKMEDEDRGREERNALARLMAGGFDRKAPDAMQRLYQTAPSLAPGVQKQWLEQDETAAKIGETTTKTAGHKLDQSIKAHEFHVQQLANVADPQTAMQWAQEGVKAGVFTPEQFQRGVQALQSVQTTEQFAQWRQRALQGGMSATEQLKAKLEAEKAAEAQRHNKSTEGLTLRGQDVTDARVRSEGAANRGVQIRGQNLTDQRERTMPRGQIVQADGGFVLVDPRTGTSRPVTGADGGQLGPKLKDVPAPIQKAMFDNATNLRRAELALSLVEGKSVGEAKGDTSATGLKGYLPNQVLNRVDPAGVDARAAIADLGSLVIHDRSGAAVTAAEFPRLAPFIPSEKDDAATVKKKLKRFVQVYRDELDSMQGAYGSDSGYRVPKGGSQPAPSNAVDEALKKYGG
jgi:hypothetical protein